MILLTILSAIFYVFSFAPWNVKTPELSALQWIAFVPILYGIHKHAPTFRKLFLYGFIFSAGITLGGFYWIVYAVQQYGGLPLPAAVSVFIGLVLVGQLQIPLYLIVRKKVLEYIHIEKWVFISGLVYAGIESIYPKLFLDTAGNAFAGLTTFAQIADIGGAFFVTMVVIIFAETLAYVLVMEQYRKKRAFLIPALIVLLSFSYGLFRENQIRKLETVNTNQPKLKVAMIQANIGDFLKLAAEQGVGSASDTVISTYLGLSEKAAAKQPDAIIWPETAYSSLFGKPMRRDEKMMEDRLLNFSRRFPGTMIFGGYDQDEKLLEYNSVFFLAPRSNVRTYHKSILLTFGETLPFSDLFPEMKSWFPTMGFFGVGNGPEVYHVHNRAGDRFKIAPQICYEGLFSTFSAKSAILGADALLNVTNDSWFGPHGEPFLHLALTQFRSIETRIPMLRSTNTGITTHINSLGELTQKTSLSEEAVLETEIRPRLPITSPYMFMASTFGGRWFERLTQFFTLILLGWLVFRQRNEIR